MKKLNVIICLILVCNNLGICHGVEKEDTANPSRSLERSAALNLQRDSTDKMEVLFPEANAKLTAQGSRSGYRHLEDEIKIIDIENYDIIKSVYFGRHGIRLSNDEIAVGMKERLNLFRDLIVDDHFRHGLGNKCYSDQLRTWKVDEKVVKEKSKSLTEAGEFELQDIGSRFRMLIMKMPTMKPILEKLDSEIIPTHTNKSLGVLHWMIERRNELFNDENLELLHGEMEKFHYFWKPREDKVKTIVAVLKDEGNYNGLNDDQKEELVYKIKKALDYSVIAIEKNLKDIIKIMNTFFMEETPDDKSYEKAANKILTELGDDENPNKLEIIKEMLDKLDETKRTQAPLKEKLKEILSEFIQSPNVDRNKEDINKYVVINEMMNVFNTSLFDKYQVFFELRNFLGNEDYTKGKNTDELMVKIENTLGINKNDALYSQINENIRSTLTKINFEGKSDKKKIPDLVSLMESANISVLLQVSWMKRMNRILDRNNIDLQDQTQILKTLSKIFKLFGQRLVTVEVELSKLNKILRLLGYTRFSDDKKLEELISLLEEKKEFIEVRFTDSARTRDSSTNLFIGIFKTHLDALPRSIAKVEHSLLKFDAECSNYKLFSKRNKDNLQVVENEKYSVPILELANEIAEKCRFPQNSISYDDLTLIYHTCAFEEVWDKKPTWCEILTKHDREVLQFVEDVELYMESGSGIDFNGEIACILFEHIVNALGYKVERKKDANGTIIDGDIVENEDPTAKKPNLVVNFGHVSSLYKLLTHLNLFEKQTIPEFLSNRGTSSRAGKSSEIGTFASNLNFLLVRRKKDKDSDDSDSGKLYIAILFQEIARPLQKCEDVVDEIYCPVESFWKLYKDALIKCEPDKLCNQGPRRKAMAETLKTSMQNAWQRFQDMINKMNEIPKTIF